LHWPSPTSLRLDPNLKLWRRHSHRRREGRWSTPLCRFRREDEPSDDVALHGVVRTGQFQVDPPIAEPRRPLGPLCEN
jgi:hypothetical protein